MINLSEDLYLFRYKISVKSYTVLHTEESIFEKRESIALGFDLLFWNIRKIKKLV